MHPQRVLAILLVIGLFGWLALLGLQWKLKLGSFATSPQRVAVPLGARRIVAGGRARIGFRAYRDAGVELEVDCAEEKTTLSLGPYAVSEEPVCGVRLQTLGVHEPYSDNAAAVTQPELDLEISWDDD